MNHQHNPPKTATQKLELRLCVARETCVADLSTSSRSLLSHEFAPYLSENFQRQARASVAALSCSSPDDVVLDVDFNGSTDFLLASVPDEVFQFPGTQRKQPGGVKERIDFNCSTELRELWLCNNKLPVVPPKIRDLQHLQTLSLRGNQLHSICPEIGLLPK
jgi:Leucine-rich repeat (LRR) protein